MTTGRARLVCVAAAAWLFAVCLHALVWPATWQGALVDTPVRGYPLRFLGEALLRAGRAGVGACLTGLVAWRLGRVVAARVLPPSDRLATCLFSAMLGTLALSTLLVVISWVGLYRRSVIVVGVAAVGLLEAVRAAGRRDAIGRPHWTSPGGWRWSELGFLLCGGASLAAALVAALAPETEYDALWYHLWLPTRWLAAGTFVDIVHEYVALYPGGWEVLNGVALTLGGPVAAKLLHWICLPILALATMELASWAAGDGARTLAAVLVLAAPSLAWEAGTAYVDLALACYVTLAAVACTRYVDTDDRRWLLVAGLLFGGALGVKHLGLIALAIATGLLVVVVTRRHGIRAAVVRVSVVCLVAVTLASPWYARAFRASGNPVFPELYGLFGARPEARWSVGSEEALRRFKDHFGVPRTPAALLALPWTISTEGARFGGTFGPLWLVLAPWSVLSARRRRLVVLVGAVAAYAAVWASPIGSFQLRFLAPAMPMVAVASAAGYVSLGEAARRVGGAGGAIVAACVVALLAVQLPPFTPLLDTDRHGWDGWLTHVLRGLPVGVVVGTESERAFLARRVPSYAAWQAFDGGAPAGANVLTFFSGDHLYSRTSRLWSDSTAAYPAVWGATLGQEADALRAATALGITHVMFDRRLLERQDVRNLAIVGPRLRACCLEPVYIDGRVELLRLRADGGASVHPLRGGDAEGSR